MYYYLDNNEEYTDKVLKLIIKNKTEISGILPDINILDRLLNMNYYDTIDQILSKFKSFINEEMINKLITGKYSKYIEWQCIFSTHEVFYTFLKHFKYLSNKTLKENLHLLVTDEDIDTFLQIWNTKKIERGYKLITYSLIKKNKQLLKIYLNIYILNFNDGYIIKSVEDNQILWKYININNINIEPYLTPNNYLDDDLDRIIYILYQTFNSFNNVNSQLSFHKIILFVKIYLSKIQPEIVKLELIKKRLIDNKNLLINEKMIDFTNQMINLIDSKIYEINKMIVASNKKNLFKLPILNDS
jgi:hypothetical protein